MVALFVNACIEHCLHKQSVAQSNCQGGSVCECLYRALPALAKRGTEQLSWCVCRHMVCVQAIVMVCRQLSWCVCRRMIKQLQIV